MYFLVATMVFGLGLIVNGAQLCDRIYVNTGDESRMPYVQLQGVYRKIGMSDGRPMFQHEQRQKYHFEYSEKDNSMHFSFKDSKGVRRGFGLKAAMTNGFALQNWVDSITDEGRPFENFIEQWDYYDWQLKSYVGIDRDTVQLICAGSDFYRCSSGKVYYNTTFNDGRGTILHNHVTDSFVEESGGGAIDYNNNRKMYRHSRQEHWILYYESLYWKVANDIAGYKRPFLRARDSSMRPEYITAVWEKLNAKGDSWGPLSFPAGIQCRGFVQKFANGTVQTCSDSDPCGNGGKCVNSKLTNKTVCICPDDYIGNTCTTKQNTCPIYRYDPKSVADVVLFGLQASNIATVFCKEGYQPKFFLSQCFEGTYITVWTNEKCRAVPKPTSPRTTRAPIWTHPRGGNTDENKEPFNFDDYPWARPVLLTIVSLLQVCVPLTHMFIAIYKDKSACRVLSLHAFISYVFWWLYCIGCVSTKCAKHGQVLGDFAIMCIVMLCCCYVLMLIESCLSPEKQYVSSILADTSAIEFVNQLKNTDPQRVMSIECYHWETRTRTVYYTDSDGNTQTRTETYQEKVVTHTESRIFPVGYAEDVSDSQGLNLDQDGVTRLKLTPDVKCGDSETQEKFNEMSDEMVEENRHMDVHIDFSYQDVIDGFKKRICAYTDPKYRKFWMNSGCYWVASLFGLSWIFRLIFNCKTKKCEYTIKKLMYLHAPYENRQWIASAPAHTNIEMDARSTLQLVQPDVCPPYQLEAVPMMSRYVPCEPPPDYNTAMAQSTKA